MTLDIITHEDLDGVTHGFFTRAGGASSGVFQGLNCGFGSSDQHEIVALNRARVAEAMGGTPAQLAGVNQIHSATIVTLTEAPADKPDADAMVTATPGVILSILTADCQPVLFADKQAGVIGAAHAGWKGTIGGILEGTIDAMEALGAKRGNITAIIGPSISQRAYEVGEEFFDRFIAEDENAARWFANGENGRYLFDLPGYGLHRLRQAGVGQAAWTRHCTYGDPARFFSYRRTTHAREADYGRLISAIRL